MKKFQCENCGAVLTVDDLELTATCEYCGTTVSLPDTYPEYAESVEDGQDSEWEVCEKTSETDSRKGLRMILLMVLAVFILACGIILTVFVGMQRTYPEPYMTEKAEYSWPTTGLAALIPAPAADYGRVEEDASEHFSSVIYDVTQAEFDSYVTDCREMGFDIEAEGSDSSFTAYRTDGSFLELYYWAEDQELSVYIDAPENMTQLFWPTDGLAAKLPKPVSKYGNVLWEDEEGISVQVYVDSKEDFEWYKDSCIQYGYTENHAYHFSDDGYGWYEAENKEGYHLDLDYEDRFYKKMYIRLEKD
ncbi:MAG: hypothetical protein IJE27_07625 [Anaerotignum sp.]|nr:hypothetical protein [Anaerotignum sp.]